MDENLKRRFNIVCTWKGVRISDIAQELIEQWVENNAPSGLFDKPDNVNNEQEKCKNNDLAKIKLLFFSQSPYTIPIFGNSPFLQYSYSL